jgi:G3E family GTPase
MSVESADGHAVSVTVVGGYLGAGKTTLINQLLRQTPNAPMAVLVNDFGAINIDAQMIESSSDNIISLTNGCMCCSLDMGVSEALYSLLELECPPTRIIIEASGVGDPAAIAAFAALPGLRLDAVAVLVDSETLRDRIADPFVGTQILRQLRSADLVVLTKCDLVSDGVVRDLRTWIAESFPQAAILLASPHTNVAAMLFADPEDPPRPQIEDRSSLVPSSHGDEYVSWSYRHDGPIEEQRLRQVIEGFDAGVLRGKGIVALTSNPLQRCAFQLVGRRWTLIPNGSWGTAPLRTELAFIALAGTPDPSPLFTQLASRG